MLKKPTLDEMQKAREAIQDVVLPTPLIPAESHSLYLKPEIHQVIHSFKIRGIFHAVQSLSEEERARGISTVSAGNTAQALAWAGRHFGIPSRSIMPEHAPQTKIDAVRALGGKPDLVPVEEVFRYLKEHLWKNEQECFIHPWIDRRVIVGHASMGLEIVEDLPDVGTVYIPVGGGALICGVASAVKALKPDTLIRAVEPAGCPALHESFSLGKPASVECHTMCDGVAVPYITEELYPLLRDLVDDVVLVTEHDVKESIKQLALTHKMVAEGSGALAYAAAIQCRDSHRGPAVSLITGGSLDVDKLVAILAS